jgi:hypothetical protein
LILLLALIACDDFESGEPPTFSGFTATALSEDQIELSWNPGEDDFLGPEELVYGIWFALPGEMIDPESTPDITTDEGATSYNLTGLPARTAVDLLVRARERGGGSFSENTETQSATTLGEGEGRYAAAIEVTLSDQPNDLIHGEILNAGEETIGVVYDRRIEWLVHDGNGAFAVDEDRTFTHDEDIIEAHVLTARGTRADLFVVSNSGLTFYQNRQTTSGDVFEEEAVLNIFPRAGTLSFVEDAERNLIVSFMNNQNTFLIYSLGEDNNDPFTDENVQLGLLAGDIPRLAFIDDDGDEQFYDLIVYGTTGLRFALDNGNQFGFETVEDAESDDDVAEGNETDVFVGAIDADNLPDLLVFARNTSEDETRLWAYQGRSDGFESRVETDYGFAFYQAPTLGDVNCDGQTDLLLPQTSSNNVAVFEGPSLSFQNVSRHEGGADGVERVAVANIDGSGGNDLAILAGTNDGYRLVLLLANPL